MEQDVARDAEVDAGRLIVVCGVGRSGTSLLQSMLGAHPAISFPPETHVFRRYVASREGRKRMRRASPAEAAGILRGDEGFARAGVPPEAVLAEEGVVVDGRVRPAALYRALLTLRARREGKGRVGDKDPKMIEVLPQIRAEFPDALVIQVVRDPRDVLLSRMKAAWSAARPWWVHPLIYREQWRRGRAEGAAAFGRRYRELRYEDLIADPGRVLRDLCSFLGLPYDTAMLAFGEAARRLVQPQELSWKSETLGPLLRENRDKWRTGLGPWQLVWCECLNARAMHVHGYRRAAPRGRRALLWPLAASVAAAFRMAWGLRALRAR